MTTLADMTDSEIRVRLLQGTSCPRTREFIASLYEDYEASEVPSIVRTLARAADAMRDQPVDFDMMDLSFRELNALLGGDEIPASFEIARMPAGAFDMPLRELGKLIGPREASLYLRQLDQKLDARAAKVSADADRVLAQRWSHPL